MTTLRVYAAWVIEADQRAAAGLASRLPSRPPPEPDGMQRVLAAPRTPYERIAVELRAAILDGTYPPGAALPTGKQLAAAHGVATGTAQRAVTLLRTWGLIDVSRGQRATVVQQPLPDIDSIADNAVPVSTSTSPLPPPTAAPVGRQLLDLEIRRLGQIAKKITTEADPRDVRELRQVLIDAIKRDGQDESRIAEYDMDIRYSGRSEVLMTFVARAR